MPRPGLAACGWLAALHVALILACFPLFLYRVTCDGGGTDFPEFYAAGRHVLEYRVRQPDSILHRYLPSVDVAWVLLAWMPRTSAAIAWYVLSSLTWWGLLRAVGRYLLPATPEPQRGMALLAAGLLTLVFTLDHLLLGAFHILMLWLFVAGLGRTMRGGRYSGPALLGAAVWLKLLPLLGVGYLLLKRKWIAAAASLGIAVGLDAVLSITAYGPSAAWSAHVKWWHSRAVGDLTALLSAPTYISQQSDRNQSPAAVLRRVLTQTGVGHKKPVHRRVAMADLSPAQLKLVYYGMTAGLAAALVFFWRRPAAGLPEPRWSAEVALLVLATLWFSPIVYSYHPTAATPALAVVLGSRWRASVLARVALTVWIMAVILMAVPEARAVGDALWASLLLGLTVVITCWRQRDRDHRSMPAGAGCGRG